MSWFERRQRPVPCWCTGYHFPHRTGGGACEHSKTRNIHLAKRLKDPELFLDALIEYAFLHGKPMLAGDPPF